MLKSFVFKQLRRIGLVPKISPELILPRLDLKVDEIIDVGVRAGTPFLYSAFPLARFILIDPQKDGERLLSAPPADYKFLNIGLSDESGVLALNEEGGRSSYLERIEGKSGIVQDRYETRVETLDWVLETELHTNSIGIKIDVEGFEHKVILGLNEQLNRVKFVLLEVTARPRFKDGYTFSDMISLMLDKGFFFYCILNHTTFPPPRHFDVLFLRRDHPLLAS